MDYMWESVMELRDRLKADPEGVVGSWDDLPECSINKYVDRMFFRHPDLPELLGRNIRGYMEELSKR